MVVVVVDVVVEPLICFYCPELDLKIMIIFLDLPSHPLSFPGSAKITLKKMFYTIFDAFKNLIFSYSVSR